MKTNKLLVLTSIVLILVSFFALPIDTSAKTIKEFEEEVEKYVAELQSKKDQVAANDAEVAEINKKINSIKKQITAAEADVEALQEEIDDSYEEIAEKSKESKAIIAYYQISDGDNSYLEYVFGATSITDMIYRMSVVEQLTEYNNKVMKELEELIENNQKKQAELKSKQKELETLQSSLEAETAKINANSQSIKETMPSVEEQIKAAQANVTYYKKLGCGQTEDIQACQYRIQQASGSSVPSANGFYRPYEYGYLGRGFSWNNSTASGSHMGIDMSSSNKSIAIYPIATGTVFAIYYDNCQDSGSSKNCYYTCNGKAKVVKIRHNVNGKYIYSTYAHLSSFGSISVGQVVTPYTVIGYMGTSGCSTGPHLHLEISSCDWHSGGGCSWATYQKSMINPTNYVTFPSRWTNR
jgi:murein DD-endopeptidase MepM/ murein hydrolase activator NlpD